jgi:hypothetical protein
MPTEAECTAEENPKHTTFVDSQGSTFTFNSTAYGATSVNLQIDGYDAGDQTVDLSTLSLPSGCCRPKVDPPLYDCGDTTSDGTLTLNWYCVGDVNGTVTELPTTDTEATLVFPKFGINQEARCTSLSLDASVGEFVTGSATFELSKTTPI